MKPTEKITITKNEKGISEETLTHPAFGTISFSRVTGGDATLFGSSIKHNDRIALRIHHAKQDRGLSQNWHMPTEKIVEVEMSYSQFTECISSMNQASGVPCTIQYTEKDGTIPAIEENVSVRNQFLKEFHDHLETAMKTVQDQIDEIQSALDNKKNLGVNDKKDLISSLNSVKMNIGCNLDYVAAQFNEQMDKTVTEAKGEVEAFCQNKIMAVAQNALVENHESLKSLESPIDSNLIV